MFLPRSCYFERLEGRMPLPLESDIPVNSTVVVNRNQERYPQIDQAKLLEGGTCLARKAQRLKFPTGCHTLLGLTFLTRIANLRTGSP